MTLNTEIVNNLIEYFEEQIEIDNGREFGSTESLNAWALLQLVSGGIAIGGVIPSTTVSSGIDNAADIELIKEKIDLLRTAVLNFQSDVNNLSVSVETSTVEGLIEEVKVTLENILIKIPDKGIKSQSESISVVPATGSNFAPNSLTNDQLRATPLDVNIDSIPLPSNSATESTLDNLNNKIPNTLQVIGTTEDISIGASEEGTFSSRLRYLSERIEILTAPRLNYRAINSNNSLILSEINNRYIKTLLVHNFGSQDIYVQFFDDLTLPEEGINATNEVFGVFSGNCIFLGEDYFWGEGLRIENTLFIGISLDSGIYTPASNLNYNLILSYR